MAIIDSPKPAGQHFLFVPGPTHVPHEILSAIHRPMEDHRSAALPEFTLPLFEDLKKIFKTQTGEILVFPASGTGGWEAALQNTLSAGDQVLAARYGQFSHLWIRMCQRYGLDVLELDAPWGAAVPVDRYHELLLADTAHTIKAVLVTHNETATGVTSDVGCSQADLGCRQPSCIAVCRWGEFHRQSGFSHG